MIEKDIEKNIIEKIKELNLEGLDIGGLWQPVETGLVKNIESSDSIGGLIIKVNPKGWETYGISTIDMQIQLSLVVRIELDPTGEHLVKYCESISGLLEQWNSVKSNEELTDFVVEGFIPGGVQISQGQGPDYDSNSKTWSVIFTFSLRGSVD